MASLSEGARQLLKELPEPGKAVNRKTVIDRLGWTQEQLDRAAMELATQGLAQASGGGGRLQRLDDLGVSTNARQLLARIPLDGSFINTTALRSMVRLDNESFTKAKEELKQAGLVRLGVGRGGRMARVTTSEPIHPAGTSTVFEKDLYEPFADWLRTTLDDQGDHAFARVHVMATPKGFARKSGEWSRPDVMAIQVSRFEWLPTVSVEVSSYEVKRAGEANRLVAVYEAAAHRRWCNQSSLVVEVLESDEEVNSRVLEELVRLGLGLYTVRRAAPGGLEVQELRPPIRHVPEPAEVDELLFSFFAAVDDEDATIEYLRAIGLAP